MTAKPTPDVEKDRQEILRLHDDWWGAHIDMDIDRARNALALGGKTLEFGLTGHTYSDKDLDNFTPTYELTAPVEFNNLKMIINGDVGWVTCEATIRYRALDSSGTGSSIMAADESETSLHFRATEIFMRDDGEGNPEWRMWHGHFSPSAPAGESRPGLDDN
jgi:hypothetical protein